MIKNIENKKLKSCGICLYKIQNKTIYILLGLPSKKLRVYDAWGFIKGRQENNETEIETAIREFKEETQNFKFNERISKKYRFFQKNQNKDIVIFLQKYKHFHSNIEKINNQHIVDIQWENDYIKFFDIKKLPPIFKNQRFIMKNILKYFKETYPEYCIDLDENYIYNIDKN